PHVAMNVRSRSYLSHPYSHDAETEGLGYAPGTAFPRLTTDPTVSPLLERGEGGGSRVRSHSHYSPLSLRLQNREAVTMTASDGKTDLSCARRRAPQRLP